MFTLQINNKFKSIIPPLLEEEYKLLESSIIEEGCRDSLIVWKQNNTLIDGHNRYEICQKHNINFDVIYYEFENESDVIDWICVNQLGRRNLTPEARADLIGKRYNNQKQQGKRNDLTSGHFDQKFTAEKIAEEEGIAECSVRRAAKFSEAIDSIVETLEDAGIEVDRSEFTSGKKKYKKSHVQKLGEIAKDDPDKVVNVWNKLEQKNSAAIKSAVREVEAERAAKDIQEIRDELITIEFGDAFELSNKLDDESIDSIITDPPYPEEYLDCWTNLSKLAMRVLKPGGWCITYSGKQHLDNVIRRMTDGGLIYYWQVIFLQTVTPAIHSRAVNTKYKPILLFQKPPITKPDIYFIDVIKGEKVEKDEHEWQQSENGFEWIIQKFTNVGDTILDPFCGAGTCAVVAMRNNRRCITYEIDEQSYYLACKRISTGQV